MSGFDEIFGLAGDIKSRLEKNLAQRCELKFAVWFEALERSTPAIKSKTITITSANFRRAMRQAFKAGVEAEQ